MQSGLFEAELPGVRRMAGTSLDVPSRVMALSLYVGTNGFVSCMSSALSEPGGAGLGTLGLSPEKAQVMAAEAGFTRFRRLDVDHGVNAFYEIRP